MVSCCIFIHLQCHRLIFIRRCRRCLFCLPIALLFSYLIIFSSSAFIETISVFSLLLPLIQFWLYLDYAISVN